MQIINWYPGHIAKAQRKLKDNLKLVDLVIEMVDSRLPVSSHFGFIDSLLNQTATVPAEKRAKILWTLMSMEIWYKRNYLAGWYRKHAEHLCNLRTPTFNLHTLFITKQVEFLLIFFVKILNKCHWILFWNA